MKPDFYTVWRHYGIRGWRRIGTIFCKGEPGLPESWPILAQFSCWCKENHGQRKEPCTAVALFRGRIE